MAFQIGNERFKHKAKKRPHIFCAAVNKEIAKIL